MVKLRARCLLVGDAAVGKSALSHVFHSDGTLFQKNYSMTTGVELLLKCVNIQETNDSVELYIIDSAGKETLFEACEKMWGEPSLLCLVFDLTNEQSFANCSRWMDRVRAHSRDLHVPGSLETFTVKALCLNLTTLRCCQRHEMWVHHELIHEILRQHLDQLETPRAGVLVGNKSDLSSRREVQASVAQEWAQSQGLEYHETSAREMENCDAPLLSLAQVFQSLYRERQEAIQNLSPG